MTNNMDIKAVYRKRKAELDEKKKKKNWDLKIRRMQNKVNKMKSRNRKDNVQ